MTVFGIIATVIGLVLIVLGAHMRVRENTINRFIGGFLVSVLGSLVCAVGFCTLLSPNIWDVYWSLITNGRMSI